MMTFLDETELDGKTTSSLDDNANFLTMNETEDLPQVMEPERPRRKKGEKKKTVLYLRLSFGNYSTTARNKMYMISSVLFMNASVVVVKFR
ncbi:hypothetical protein COOONC_00248 [Cooperia oncophora]